MGLRQNGRLAASLSATFCIVMIPGIPDPKPILAADSTPLEELNAPAGGRQPPRDDSDGVHKIRLSDQFLA